MKSRPVLERWGDYIFDKPGSLSSTSKAIIAVLSRITGKSGNWAKNEYKSAYYTKTGQTGGTWAHDRYTYKPISERFQYFLQDLSRIVGDKQHGIMVADHRGKKQDEGFRLHHHDLVNKENKNVSSYPNYVETLFLTPSHHSIGIQLVDLVAGAIGRAMNTGQTHFARLIKPALRTGPKGKIWGYGLVRFPGK